MGLQLISCSSSAAICLDVQLALHLLLDLHAGHFIFLDELEALLGLVPVLDGVDATICINSEQATFFQEIHILAQFSDGAGILFEFIHLLFKLLDLLELLYYLKLPLALELLVLLDLQLASAPLRRDLHHVVAGALDDYDI